MRHIQSIVLRHSLALAWVVAGSAAAQQSSGPGNESNTTALLDKHAALAGQLAQNQYRRPLFLESSEGANTVSGDAYAVLDSPFSTVSTTFKSPNRWCEVLILHLNTKYCRASADTSPSTLAVSIGRKTAQQLKDASSIEFAYHVAAASPNYLATQLNADKGPLSTSNYRIELQAVPLPEGKTFMHLRYSYGYGMAGRLAMQAYLATLGRGKVGFTQINQEQKSVYVGGMRGIVERNTMRYYLAIEAYMATLSRPPAQQPDARLQYWFDATEEYAQQLHEVDRNNYLDMKKDEHQRQQAPSPG
ncbi:MAG: hypothetical protein ACREXV_10470 [Polaromonas sp.]